MRPLPELWLNPTGRIGSGMRLIPTHCEACERCALVTAEAIIGSSVRCAQCGALSRPLPGESYGSQDAALFKDLEASLSEAQLTPRLASQLVEELDERRLYPGRALKRMAKLLPSLSILELIVGIDPATVRKAEGMLFTLLEASAARRSRSGEIPAVAARAKANGAV